MNTVRNLVNWRVAWFILAVLALVWAAVTTRYETINPGGNGAPALIRDRWTGATCIITMQRVDTSSVATRLVHTLASAPPADRQLIPLEKCQP